MPARNQPLPNNRQRDQGSSRIYDHKTAIRRLLIAIDFAALFQVLINQCYLPWRIRQSPHKPITKTAVSFVHCFPSCIASSQRLCPFSKDFTAPSSSRSTFITWGRSAGTFIVASLAHLSPLVPSPNQHIQCSASTGQTIQTTSPMHNTLLGPSSAPGFHKPPPESPTALIGPIAGVALFPLSRLSFRQHQHIVFASSFFGTSTSLLLIDMLQRPSNSRLIDNGTSFPSRLPSTTPSVRHRLTSFQASYFLLKHNKDTKTSQNYKIMLHQEQATYQHG